MKNKWLGIFLFTVSIWELFAWIINKPELFPHVNHLFISLWDLFTSGHFYLSVITTICRGMIGIVLSVICAFITSVIFSRKKLIYELFQPILIFMRSVPVISFILLALILLNPEHIPLLIAFLTMFPLLVENLTKGINHLDSNLLKVGKQFRIKRINKITQIYYPQLKPFLFSGLSSAMGFGWRAIIMGEVLSQCKWGIGTEMKKAQLFIEIPELTAWTLIAVIISFVFNKGISYMSNLQLPIIYTSSPPTISKTVHQKDVLLQDISFRYTTNEIIKNFSYQFTTSKIYGISAPSGAGKTTLLSLINKSIIPQKGNILINPEENISNVFQEPLLFSHLTVKENIILPLTTFFTKPIIKKEVKRIVSAVELESVENFYPSELSYGQQQRVAIARALVFPAAILLMDEPFKGLDKSLVQRIIEYILKENKTKNRIIIFTTHDPEELKMHSEEIINL